MNTKPKEVIKPIKVHVQPNKTQVERITPIKVANIRKKVVFAPYLITFVDYIITGTMNNTDRDMKDEALPPLTWQERGDKPKWAGLLFPAYDERALGFGNEHTTETIIICKQKGIFNQNYVVHNTIQAIGDYVGVILNERNECDGYMNKERGSEIGKGEKDGKQGKKDGNTNGNTDGNTDSTHIDIAFETDKLVYWLRVMEPRVQSISLGWPVKLVDIGSLVVTNKLDKRPIFVSPTLAVQTVPSLRWSSLSRSAAWSGFEGELVLDIHQELQKLATSTWLSLRSSVTSAASRVSKSGKTLKSGSGIGPNPDYVTQEGWMTDMLTSSDVSSSKPTVPMSPRPLTGDLKQGKTLQFKQTHMITNNTIISQYIKENSIVYWPPNSILMPPTVRLANPVFTTLREEGGWDKEANAIPNTIQDRVGLEDGVVYHLLKRSPMHFYRIAWVS